MIEASTIIFIHQYLSDYFADKEDPISPSGVKNLSGIEAAVARPNSCVGNQDLYPSVFKKAAALFHSLVGNHAFYNGNKRAALLSTIYYLSEFGYLLDKCDDDEMYEFTRKIAAHELTDNANEITQNRQNEVCIIAAWLEKHSRKEQKMQNPIKLDELRVILENFGYQLIKKKEFFHIKKNNKFISKILKKGTQGAEDYDAPYVAKLRRKLKLTPEYGIDSVRFYGHKGITNKLSSFMQHRYEVMRRLAKI